MDIQREKIIGFMEGHQKRQNNRVYGRTSRERQNSRVYGYKIQRDRIVGCVDGHRERQNRRGVKVNINRQSSRVYG
jgi:hypothetical protein